MIRTFAEYIDGDFDCVPDDANIAAKAISLGSVYYIHADQANFEANSQIYDSQLRSVYGPTFRD